MALKCRDNDVHSLYEFANPKDPPLLSLKIRTVFLRFRSCRSDETSESKPVQLYLPIAEIPVNIFMILGMGAAVGFLSGMFGVGGGFLITPLLIFIGVPPAVSVATGANQIIASSVTGALFHFRRGSVDIKLGTLLLLGGFAGAGFGVWLFKLLRELGQLDLVVSLCYVLFLGVVGGLMTVESLMAMRRASKDGPVDRRRPGQHGWIHALPFKVRFRRSKLYLSAVPVLVLGALVGILSSIMGVGGGFIMVPAMIYLLRVPTNVVIGTSLFQIVFVTAFTTVSQSVANQSVDVVLALILMIGGVTGAQFGAQIGQKLRGEQLRALLGVLVLAVCVRMAVDLVITPGEFYSMARFLSH